ncbi:MAG TPA: energy transducer TonB [Bryobacteraceae bacterium]|nr:energy transducer TonB [Bryobacteraceae bacterium]
MHRQALGGEREPGNWPEQFQKRGVYIGVFEQSLLIENATNKSWSFLASVSAELVAVSLLILIPLIYGDHLPEFHWRSVTVGAPPRPIDPPPPNLRPANGVTRSSVFHRSTIDLIYPTFPRTSPTATQPGTIDLPSYLPASDSALMTINPIGDRFGKPVPLGPPPPTPPRKADPPSAPLRVSQGVQMAKLLKQVMPVYPPMAKIAHISGTVRLLGIIAKDGTIRNLQVIGGHPWLARAAVDAVSQWVYRPTLLSGEAVEVICPIDVNFTLSNN